MVINKVENIEKVKVEIPGAVKAYKQVTIGQADKTPMYSLRVFTLEPGGNTPYHTHNYEHLNYIIEGEGYLVDEAGNEKPIVKGEFALVEPNEKHMFKNGAADKNFVFICAVPKEFE